MHSIPFVVELMVKPLRAPCKIATALRPARRVRRLGLVRTPWNIIPLIGGCVPVCVHAWSLACSSVCVCVGVRVCVCVCVFGYLVGGSVCACAVEWLCVCARVCSLADSNVWLRVSVPVCSSAQKCDWMVLLARVCSPARVDCCVASRTLLKRF